MLTRSPGWLVAAVVLVVAVACSDGRGEPPPAGSRAASPSAPSAAASGASGESRVIASLGSPTAQRVLHRAFGPGRGHFGRRSRGDLPTFVPAALAVGPDGEIAVVDTVNNRLVRFGRDGRHLADVAIRPRTREASLTNVIYDAARQRYLVLDDLANASVSDQRLLTVTSAGVVREVLFPALSSRGALAGAYPIAVDPLGTVYGFVGEGAVSLVTGDAAVSVAHRRSIPGMPFGRSVLRLTASTFTPGPELRVSVFSADGRRDVDVVLPHEVAAAYYLPLDGADVWVAVDLAVGEAFQTAMVRLSADLGSATYFPIRFDPVGDITRFAAIDGDDVLVLTGAGDGMDVVRYSL